MSENHASFPGGSFLLVLLFSIVATWVAKSSGFFRFPPKTLDGRPTTKELVKFYLFFVVFSLFLLPLVVKLFAKFFFPASIHTHQIGWLQVLSLLCSLLVMIFYCFFAQRAVFLSLIRGQEGNLFMRKFLDDVKWGTLALIFAIPVVQTVQFLLNFFIRYFWHTSGIEQSAVQQLKSVLNTPLLFTALALIVSFIVPFLEELLFRGYLQSWLGLKMKRSYAILLTSLIFACFHFSTTQGIGNIELIGTLFVLSCYLGIVFEKQRSLWAPFTLHALFNFSSALVIFLEKA